jgi:hypothetical protein
MSIVRFTTAAAALALLLGTGGPASADGPFQIRADRDDTQFGRSLDPRQHGYEHAYRDGADRGRFDREHGVRYNLKAKGYNDSSRGYESFMGNKGQYQKGYREGYKAGYDSAYRNTSSQYGQSDGRTDGNRDRRDQPPDPYASRRWGATDLANDVGYSDGIAAGQYDRGRNVSADYQSLDAYRDADHGYSGNYGDRGAYRTRYRTGFARGYQDGYGRSR